MTALDLRSFVTRSRALVDSSPPTTRRETRAWLVDPLLETLGWTVHADSCLTERTVDGTDFEYVCTIDSIPGLFVAVEPYPEALERERASAICQTMAWTGVDRAIYTNGRQLLFLAGTSDVDQFHCQLSAIADYESSIAAYTNERIGHRLERHSRHHVARQFALERSTLVDAIVDQLTAVSSQTYESEFESATDRFLEGLVASFATDTRALPAADESDAEGISIQFRDSAAGTDESIQPGDTDLESDATQSTDPVQDDSTGEPADRSPADTSTDAEKRETTPSSPEPTETSETDDDRSSGDATRTDDGEYVVRFFNDSSSIGAIGHGTSEQALVHAAEYCFDRGLSGITVPWPDGDESDVTVLNEQPVHADGSPMAAAEQLSNGLSLNTAGSVADHAARVEALASRSGLRAMLTGDWETDR